MIRISKNQFSDLGSALGEERVEQDRILAPYTTFRIGGPADAFYEASTANELAAALEVARTARVPHFVLGLGANILMGDLGFRGLVIRNAARDISISETGILQTESGAVVWPDVIDYAIDAGWSGLEHFAGIPSTIGGALWQNLHFLSPAPARERTIFIDEVVLDAEILTPENERKRVDRAFFDFGYDHSVLHHSGDIVLSARFQLQPGDTDAMRQIVEDNLEWRRHRHPPLNTEPSAGSIFKKIDGVGAGRLIDECGLKGTRFGCIEITQRHANIMINRTPDGDHDETEARASDVRKLIEHVIKTVAEQTGHVLEPEISFVGEF